MNQNKESMKQLASFEKSRGEQAKLERTTNRVISMIDNKDFYGLDEFFERESTFHITELKDEKGYSMLHLSCYKNIESISLYFLRKVKEKYGP